MIQHRLLEIAIDAFGQRGLEGASTREIASAAGTAMSSITYHYGGKEGLYLAAADYISAKIAETMSPLCAIEVAVADAAGARQAIHDILDALVERMLDADTESWSLFIAREQMRPTAAFARLFEGAMGTTLRRLIALVAITTRCDDDEAAGIAALTLFGQVLVLRSAHTSLLTIMNCKKIHAPLAERIRLRVSANCDAILNAMAAERPSAH